VIGEWIVQNRRLVSRADFHGAKAEPYLLPFANLPKHADAEALYFLSQKDVLRHFINKWGNTIDDVVKQFTVDDKLRLGLLAFHDDVREFVRDILSKTKAAPPGENNNHNRANLDACPARKKSGLQILLNLFKDFEVIVTLPPQWLSDAAKEKVNLVLPDLYPRKRGS
jgi:hypothetical protein